MKTEEKSLADFRIKTLEANMGHLDSVCDILKLQGKPETIQLIRLIQASLMAMIDGLKSEKSFTLLKLP